MRKVIVLCSGGLDSVVAAHFVRKKKKAKDITILFFNYGQRSLLLERKSSQKCARDIGAKFIEISLPELHALSYSIINKQKPHKKLDRNDLANTTSESKNWYVPYRNTLFISYALALADSEPEAGKCVIVLGFKCEGTDPYPDTTKEYVTAMNSVARIGGKVDCEICAPFIDWDKEDIIKEGISLNVPLEKTVSCYVAKNKQCGTCLACMLRKEGFYWAGIKDKTPYETP